MTGQGGTDSVRTEEEQVFQKESCRAQESLAAVTFVSYTWGVPVVQG